MYILNTGANTIELKAKASAYRKLKQTLGVSSLRAAFMKAYSDMDIDFLAKLLECFVADKEELTKRGGADGVIDECLDNGIQFESLYSEIGEFLNGMGFFGDLHLKKNQRAIEWFKEPMNAIDMDAKLADALNNGLDQAVAQIVKERVLTD